MKLEEAINGIRPWLEFEKSCECNKGIKLLYYIETALQELDRLQKENEKLKEIDLTTVHIKGVCDERERWRNKIREKIEEYRNKEDITEMCALQDLLKEE